MGKFQSFLQSFYILVVGAWPSGQGHFTSEIGVRFPIYPCILSLYPHWKYDLVPAGEYDRTFPPSHVAGHCRVIVSDNVSQIRSVVLNVRV